MAEIQFKTMYDWWRDRMREKKEKEKKERRKKYLAGYLDFGILGKRDAYLFKNDRKEKDNQPAFRLVIKDGDAWKEVGAFWVREIKPREEEEVIDFV